METPEKELGRQTAALIAASIQVATLVAKHRQQTLAQAAKQSQATAASVQQLQNHQLENDRQIFTQAPTSNLHSQDTAILTAHYETAAKWRDIDPEANQIAATLETELHQRAQGAPTTATKFTRLPSAEPPKPTPDLPEKVAAQYPSLAWAAQQANLARTRQSPNQQGDQRGKAAQTARNNFHRQQTQNQPRTH